MTGPNMSYCQCENTLAAVKQVINSIQYEGELFFEELSDREQRALKQLVVACETLADLVEETSEETEHG